MENFIQWAALCGKHARKRAWCVHPLVLLKAPPADLGNLYCQVAPVLNRLGHSLFACYGGFKSRFLPYPPSAQANGHVSQQISWEQRDVLVVSHANSLVCLCSMEAPRARKSEAGHERWRQ